jgi:translation initiation factor IF-2
LRVHELAKELGVTSKELIAALEEMGVSGRTASSSVPDAAVPRLRASGGHIVPGQKVRGAVEEPRPKAKTKPKKEAPVTPQKEGSKAKAKVEAASQTEAKTAAKPSAKKARTTKPAATQTESVDSPADVVVIPDRSAPTAPATPAAAVAEPATSQGGPVLPPAAGEPATPAVPALPTLRIAHGATAQELAEKAKRTPAEVVRALFDMGEMATATTSLTDEALRVAANDLGFDADIVGVTEDLAEDLPEDEVDEARLQPRPPVVTVMGHVDHGKTRLLDAIRSTDVVSGEFGGITQHIGAYQVRIDGREITFIDTPGHEAFTAMRARGAQVTDIAVLVVAADDGVMPQTVEALDHAKAAGVPIIVAVNKIDKPEADPARARNQMVEHGVVPSEWGGETEFVDVSAKAHQNIDSLLETILLVAELGELRADPGGRSRGTVIEANLDKGRGPLATVLVQRGTLEVGDALIAGTSYARIRAMQDENGRPVDRAGPSKPVLILGWSAVPNAGDDFREVADEREARHIAQERESRARAAELVVSSRPPTLADLMEAAADAEVPELNLVLKADVQGSLGALADAFLKLPQDEVRIRIIHSAAGGITENDIALALASKAIVIGFNVRPNAAASALADAEGVDVRLYRVIYEAIEDVKQALSGLLAPEQREEEKGRAEVRATFRVPKIGLVAGCYVLSGTVTRGSRVRLVRDGVIVYDGRVGSLRRFKDDVREVAEGYECGIGIENFNDVKEGDIIEAYEVREVARSL